MKKTILLISIIFLFYRCSNPGPTELLQDDTSVNENVDLQVVSTNPDEIVYSNGYDSTGIVDQYIDKSSVISVSGIRYSNFVSDSHIAYYYAVFNDKANPILNSRGRQLGYRTRILGSVRFNNVAARVLPYLVKYMFNSVIRDTLVGSRYVLVQNLLSSSGANNFPYSSEVSVRITGLKGKAVDIDVPTPPEVLGEVRTSGSMSQNNFTINLLWNGTNKGKVEIILGLLKSGAAGENVFSPLIKIGCPDNGRLKIDSGILSKIPLTGNDVLVLTLIRRQIKEVPNNEILNDSYIVAQSIHNIKVDIPR